jgi:hypothetical protein
MSHILMGLPVTVLLLMTLGELRRQMELKAERSKSAARNEAGFS